MFEKGNTYGFKKGQSGNPEGRPKGSISINDSVRKILAGKDTKTKRKILDAIAEQIVKQAIKGDREFNPTMMIQLWQQIDGKPKQQIDLGGQEGNPIRQELTLLNASQIIDNKPKKADEDD